MRLPARLLCASALAFGLSVAPGTPIFIGQTNIDHMKASHPADFEKYFSCLEEILANPDWVIPDPEGGGIQFVRQIDTRVIVAVRASGSGAFSRLLCVNTCKRCVCTKPRSIECGTNQCWRRVCKSCGNTPNSLFCSYRRCVT